MDGLDELIRQLEEKEADYKKKLNNLKNIDGMIETLQEEIAQLEEEDYGSKIREIENELKEKHQIKELNNDAIRERIKDLKTENEDLRSKTIEYEKQLERRSEELKHVEDSLNSILSDFSSLKIEGKTFKDLLNDEQIRNNIDQINLEEGDFIYVNSFLEALIDQACISREDIEKWDLKNPDILKNLKNALNNQ